MIVVFLVFSILSFIILCSECRGASWCCCCTPAADCSSPQYSFQKFYLRKYYCPILLSLPFLCSQSMPQPIKKVSRSKDYPSFLVYLSISTYQSMVWAHGNTTFGKNPWNASTKKGTSSLHYCVKILKITVKCLPTILL